LSPDVKISDNTGVTVSLREAAAKLRVPIALACGALAVRIVWLLLQGGGPITWDGAEYARTGANILHGLGFVGMHGTTMFTFPPLYPLAIAAMMLVTRHAETAGIAISLLAGAALVFPVYGLAALMYGRRAALVAGTIVAFLPFAVDLSVVVLSDSLFTLLAASALYTLVRSFRDGSWRFGACSGALFALGYLTRPEGLVLGGAGFLALVCAFALLPSLRRRLFTSGAAYVFALAIVASPYVVFLSTNAHALRFEAKSAVNATIAAGMRSGLTYVQAADGIDNNLQEIGPELDAKGYFVDASVRPMALRERLSIMASSALRRLVDIPRKLITKPFGTPILALLAVVGLFAGPWHSRRIADTLALLGYGGALFVSLTSVYHFWDRYAFGFTTLLAVWGAHGVDVVARTLLARLRRPSASRRIAAVDTAFACVLAVGFLTLLASLHGWFKDAVNDAGTPTERTIGTWIARNDAAPGQILAVSDQSVFYANGTWAMLPYVPRDGLALAYVRKKNPRYLVLDRDQATERPYILAWLSHGVPDARARLVHVVGEPSHPDAAIYRWTQTPVVAGP
jgi:hypothetical protein